jgi:hypothetical protein
MREIVVVALNGAECVAEAAKILRRYYDGQLPRNAVTAMQEVTVLAAGVEALKDAVAQMEEQLARMGFVHEQRKEIKNDAANN